MSVLLSTSLPTTPISVVVLVGSLLLTVAWLAKLYA
jgi:hypothetical protein